MSDNHPYSYTDGQQRHSSHPGYHDVSLADPNLIRPHHPQHHNHVNADHEAQGHTGEPTPSAMAHSLAGPIRSRLHSHISHAPTVPLVDTSSASQSPYHNEADQQGISSEHLMGKVPISGDVADQEPAHRHRHNQRLSTGIFEFAHARRTNRSERRHHLDTIDEQEPIKVKHLFKRPVIRQWLYNGNYYREKDERQSSRFELFSDLLFVGVVHQLADGLAEAGAATALNVAKFVLVFYPAFSMWSDMKRQLNMSGTDDCYQRYYVLTIMLILVGYTSNAAGIMIYKAEEGSILGSGNEHAEADGSGTEGVTAQTVMSESRRALSAAVDYGLQLLDARSEAEESVPILVEPIGNTGYWFAEGFHKGVYSAVGFYLVAKLLKLILHFSYGLFLPKFRTALWLEMIPIFLLALTYLPLAFIYSPVWICVIITAGIAIDMIGKYVINLLLQRVHRYYKHKGKPIFIPAQSVEHLAERTILFVVLVTGECILNSTFVANSRRYGVSRELLRASLSIINSFYIVWIYFDCDASRTFLHALRVNPWSAITFSLLHFPLCAALIVLSSVIPRLIEENSSELGYRWFYACSMSVAMFCMALIGLLHRNLDLAGSSYWPRKARIALRAACSVAFLLIPLAKTWNNLVFLLVYNQILGLLVFSETFGKIGVVGRRFDKEKADAYYTALKSDDDDDDAVQRGEKQASTSPDQSGSGMTASHPSDDLKRLSEVHFSPLRMDLDQRVSSFSSPLAADGTTTQAAGEEQEKSTYPPLGQGGGVGKDAAASHTAFSGRFGALRSRTSSLSQSAADLGRKVDGAINPHTARVQLKKTDSWHPYEDLTRDERGDEDVGVEGELGQMEVKERMDAGQRWALVAN